MTKFGGLADFGTHPKLLTQTFFHFGGLAILKNSSDLLSLDLSIYHYLHTQSTKHISKKFIYIEITEEEEQNFFS